LAGFDPAEVSLRLVIDMSQALLVEVYREYGMKFEEARSELDKRLGVSSISDRKKEDAPDDAASMAILQAMMSGSDFRGPKG
jgi:hypothetical protein